MKLSRDEVRAPQAPQLLGSVCLYAPVAFTLATVVALVLALVMVVFAALGEVTRKARLSPLLVPNQESRNIIAQQSGVLTELPVTEGQTAIAGNVLSVLRTERQAILNGPMGDPKKRAALQIEVRKQSLTAEHTQRELQNQRREQALTDRIRNLQAEIRQSEEGRSRQRHMQLALQRLAQAGSNDAAYRLNLQLKRA